MPTFPEKVIALAALAASAAGGFSCPGPVIGPGTRVFGYRVVATFPHDASAFTQGLAWDQGRLFEGTGLNGGSTLREVVLETGAVLRQVALAREFFGEGIVIVGEAIYQLTWLNREGFIYDRDTFALIGGFTYPTEGWGITHDGSRFIMSDGTAAIRFRDHDTFAEIGRIDVHDENGPVRRLNELEYIDGRIWANVWNTNFIAIIDPATGAVESWVDLTGLRPSSTLGQSDSVLNGIAYDAANDRLFVTGKRWPSLFEIALVAPTP